VPFPIHPSSGLTSRTLKPTGRPNNIISKTFPTQATTPNNRRFTKLFRSLLSDAFPSTGIILRNNSSSTRAHYNYYKPFSARGLYCMNIIIACPLFTIWINRIAEKSGKLIDFLGFIKSKNSRYHVRISESDKLFLINYSPISIVFEYIFIMIKIISSETVSLNSEISTSP